MTMRDFLPFSRGPGTTDDLRAGPRTATILRRKAGPRIFYVAMTQYDKNGWCSL